MAVGKGNERRREMTERIPFADCHAAVGKGFSYFFIIEFLSDCLCWQVVKGSLPTAFLGRWQKALCRLPLLAGGKAAISKILACFFYFVSQI